jgi:hypothetical protein
MSHRDTIAALIFLGGGFHFKAIERATLGADPDLGKAWPDLPVEPVLVHAEEPRRIAKADKARGRRPGDLKNHLRPPATCGSGRLGMSCHSK